MTAPDDAKARVRAQYGAVGDAYVRSASHASGNDLRRMVELAQPRPHEVLLDLATGGGHVAKAFAPLVQRVIASDLTPEILEHAGRFLRGESALGNVDMLLADAEDIPLADGAVDLVTCRIAPHHFPNPAAFVQEAARVLRPGGRFVLVDSTVEAGEAGMFFNAFERVRDPSHVRALTIEEWLALIAAAGLTIHHHESFAKRHDFAEWTARSRMSDTERDRLERMLLAASDTTQRAHNVEITNGRLTAFTDTKTLFLATKS